MVKRMKCSSAFSLMIHALDNFSLPRSKHQRQLLLMLMMSHQRHNRCSHKRSRRQFLNSTSGNKMVAGFTSHNLSGTANRVARCNFCAVMMMPLCFPRCAQCARRLRRPLAARWALLGLQYGMAKRGARVRRHRSPKLCCNATAGTSSLACFTLATRQPRTKPPR